MKGENKLNEDDPRRPSPPLPSFTTARGIGRVQRPRSLPRSPSVYLHVIIAALLSDRVAIYLFAFVGASSSRRYHSPRCDCLQCMRNTNALSLPK